MASMLLFSFNFLCKTVVV